MCLNIFHDCRVFSADTTDYFADNLIGCYQVLIAFGVIVPFGHIECQSVSVNCFNNAVSSKVSGKLLVQYYIPNYYIFSSRIHFYYFTIH